jgi:hypothetical protein
MQENLTEWESCACEKTCVWLQSKDGKVELIPIPDQHTSQEETDIRIMLHMQHPAENDDKAIIVRSPDTDVMIFLLT